MDWKKFLLAWVVGAVVIFMLSYLWHMVLMKPFFDENAVGIEREEVMVLPVILGIVILALLMTVKRPAAPAAGRGRASAPSLRCRGRAKRACYALIRRP